MRHADGGSGEWRHLWRRDRASKSQPIAPLSLLCLLTVLAAWSESLVSLELSYVGKLIREESRNARESGHLL